MKALLYVLLASAMLVTSISCTKENNNDAELARLHADLDRIQKENEELNKELNKPITQKPPTGDAVYSDAFLTNFCDFAKEDVKAIDIFPHVKLVSNLEETYIARLKQIAPQFEGCQFERKLFYDYPFDIAEFKVNGGYAYVEAIYDPELKVRSFVPIILPEQLSLTLHKIKARDGVELTTYVAQKAGATEKKGSVFLRTPYMLYGHYLHYIRMALAYDKVFVLQANRGSHSSTGQFKWLDSVNVADGEDSVNWIAGQSFSNGKVVAYGVSYDGYNALAVAGNNPQGLKSVIACSAPANAATDSFTSGKFVEKYIFSYISTDRRANSLALSGVLSPLVDIGTEKSVRDQIDNILLGDDLDEWNELSRAIDDQNDVYWTDRSLYNVLSQTTVPILHIAGLHRDQDGRDTLLAFDHIQKTSSLKDNHFLALHQYGHGCGDTNRLEVYKKMMALTDTDHAVDLKSEKKIHQFVKKENGFVSVDDASELPLEEKVSVFADDIVLDDFKYYVAEPEEDPEKAGYQTQFVIPVEEAFTLNGALKLDITYKASAPQVPLHVFVIISKGEGEDREVLESGWRTGLVTGDQINVIETKSLTFPLMNAEVPEGAEISVYLATVSASVFYRQPEVREQFVPAADSPAQITILSSGEHKTQLVFPVEI